MHLFMFLLVTPLLPHIKGTNLTEYDPKTPLCDSDEFQQEGLSLVTLEDQLFTHCEEIKSLNLTESNITIIQNHVFKNMKNLKQIDLSSNMISTLPTDIFYDTENLENLYISNNNITSLKRNLFTNLRYLQSVDFQYNNITYIEEECFVNVPSLTTIDLSHNNLKTLQFNIIDDASSLKAMYLVGNPWHCDEDLCEFMHTVVTRFWHEPLVPSCALTIGDSKLTTFKEMIETPVPAIIANGRVIDYFRTEPVVMKCHICGNASVTWLSQKLLKREEAMSYDTRQTFSSGKYYNMSTITIDKFSLHDVGNYTCYPGDCPTCKKNSWVYMKVDYKQFAEESKKSLFEPINFNTFGKPEVPIAKTSFAATGISAGCVLTFILGICIKVFRIYAYCAEKEEEEAQAQAQV